MAVPTQSVCRSPAPKFSAILTSLMTDKQLHRLHLHRMQLHRLHLHKQTYILSNRCVCLHPHTEQSTAHKHRPLHWLSDRSSCACSSSLYPACNCMSCLHCRHQYGWDKLRLWLWLAKTCTYAMHLSILQQQCFYQPYSLPLHCLLAIVPTGLDLMYTHSVDISECICTGQGVRANVLTLRWSCTHTSSLGLIMYIHSES